MSDARAILLKKAKNYRKKNMTKKCVIKDIERYVYDLIATDEALQWYGQDYLNDFGCEVSVELIEQYNKMMIEFRKMQSELNKIHEESLRKRSNI